MPRLPIVVKAWLVSLMIIFFAQGADGAALLAILVLFLGLVVDDIINAIRE